MFISFDDGKNWEQFQQDLPVTPITDIKVHRKDLVLSTMGRGFYIVDNLSTLYQNFDQIKQNEVVLFQPKDTYRYRYQPFRRPHGLAPSPPYPQPSVIIDYFLPKKFEGTLQLQIVNAEGKTVRTFTNKDLPTKAKSERDMATNEISYSINSNLKSSKGAHRFRWDLRNTGAWSKKKNQRFKRGPYAAPGKYTVRLLADGQTLEQSFELMADPRILQRGVTLDDLKKQEILALQVVDLLSSARQKANDIEKEIKQLKPNQKSELQKLEALKKELVRAEGRYTETRFINQVEYLLGILRGGDQLPGKDAYDRYEELVKEYEQLVD
jgi:hypothetical protein